MSDKELYLATSACDVFYNKELNAVQTSWKGLDCTGSELHRILNALVELLETKKSSVIIADARKMKIILKRDQSWIVDDWYPRALKAGFRTEALIIARYTFNEHTINEIVKSYDEAKVTTRYFATVEEAEDWVRALNKTKS